MQITSLSGKTTVTLEDSRRQCDDQTGLLLRKRTFIYAITSAYCKQFKCYADAWAEALTELKSKMIATISSRLYRLNYMPLPSPA